LYHCLKVLDNATNYANDADADDAADDDDDNDISLPVSIL
jgi:hypothetical protein